MSLERVEKLLRLARDQEGRPEGESARRAAVRIMEEKGWTGADIEIVRIATDAPAIGIFEPRWDLIALLGALHELPAYPPDNEGFPSIEGPLTKVVQVLAIGRSVRRAVETGAIDAWPPGDPTFWSDWWSSALIGVIDGVCSTSMAEAASILETSPGVQETEASPEVSENRATQEIMEVENAAPDFVFREEAYRIAHSATVRPVPERLLLPE